MLAGVATARAQPLQEVQIGLASSTFVAGTARIAKELGLFAGRGLDARLTVLDSGNATVTALVSRSIKFIVSGTGDLITARARGQDVVAVANTYNGYGAVLIVSREVAGRSGLTPASPVADRLKALDGLLIATASPTSVSTITLKKAAEAVGATIRFVYMAQPAHPAALESGAVQGHIGGTPSWVRSVTSGKGVLWINGPRGEFPAETAPETSALLGAMRDTVAREPDLVGRLAAVFDDFAKAVAERPDDVKAAILRLNPDLDARTVDLVFDTEATAWKTIPLTRRIMAHEIEYTKALGNTPQAFDGLDPAAMLWHP